MKYVKKHTRIPVPEVLAYDPDDDKSVGGEWMVMEKVRDPDPSELKLKPEGARCGA
ncbi:hypothetical protein NEOLEDRAFT_1136181 [Neolentinus lepideus HHB14362 ss-1]|uniref:Uncharacterized protein n=1 Tax=Neolentinus lepideus HHB14362 ss-1 TaxID=1314782 RepID=A0A165REB1_9AGAM|nr:hypothetical protein NEOLEDRAFT_1136181 [Neolentinus lepideus HHB14362 ss-1]